MPVFWNQLLFLKHFLYGLTSAGLLLAGVVPAKAHFEPGTQVRQFVILQELETTEVFLRVPLPLIFADILSGSAEDTVGFLKQQGHKDTPDFVLSAAAVASNRAAFSARLAAALEWRVGTRVVAARVRAYRLLHERPPIGFTSAASARDSLSLPSATGDIRLANGHVELSLSVAGVAEAAPLIVRSTLPQLELPEGVALDNHIVDFRSDIARTFTRPGQLRRPLMLPVTQWGVTLEYVYQGVVHIIEGMDHVFLVVVMALGASGMLALFRNITAFTLGHAVTLVAGFFGFVPAAGWFIPTIEAAISATILFAALASLREVTSSALMFCVIGLLHGFGFSFVLGNVLGPESPHIAKALAAFTLGIELGQLFIVFVVLALVTVTRRLSGMAELRLRQTVLIGLAAIALAMLVERVPMIIA